MVISKIENILNQAVLFLLVLSNFSSCISILFYKKDIFDYKKFAYLIFLFLSLLLMSRLFQYNHLPLTNLYESCIFLSWSISFIVVIISKKIKNNWLHLVFFPSILCIFIFPTVSIPKEISSSDILVPALQSNWLVMHVSMMILSYGSLLFGSLLAITILVLNYDYKILPFKKSFNKKEEIDNNFIYDYISLNKFDTNLQLHIFYIKKYMLIDQLDNWSYRTIGIGFIFLTTGILSGAVWANEAWGSYWSWDPKETWALITWLIFAIYLHTRIVLEWKKKSSAMIALIGFIFIWICYLGVNILGKGFHSYGWFN